MEHTYWHKQKPDKPIFPDIAWGRPENRFARGKLLIIGGNAFGFAAVQEAYQAADKGGAGTVRILLPSAIQKSIGMTLDHADYGASNPSGSFSQQAFGEWLTASMWADGVLVAGDLGRNSETAIVMEKYLTKYSGAVTLTKDAVDYMIPLAMAFQKRPNTSLVLSIAQLQKIAMALHFKTAITFGMTLVQLIEALHEFTQEYSYEIITVHHDTCIVAVHGHISTTPLVDPGDSWRVATAAHSAVWRLQNPSKPFEALTTAQSTVAL